MKKGLLSILASALLVVGCQNYDDQFSALETQINALASTVAGLSQVQSDLTSLANTVNSLQSSVAQTVDAALADGLADIDAAVASLEAATANAASAEDVAAIATGVSENQADLDDLLAQSSVFSGAVIVNSVATLDAYHSMGDALAIVANSVTINPSAEMDATKLAELSDVFKTITGDLNVTSAASTIAELVFTNLTGVASLTMEQAGGYHFPVLGSASSIYLSDKFESTITRVNFPALTSVQSMGTDSRTNGVIEFTKATEMSFAALPRYGASLSFTTKKGKAELPSTLDISALRDVDSAGEISGLALSISGPNSVTISALDGKSGTLTLANVLSATVTDYDGAITINGGVETFTSNNVVSLAGTMADLVTVDITGVIDPNTATDKSGPAIDFNGLSDLVTASLDGNFASVDIQNNGNIETLTFKSTTNVNNGDIDIDTNSDLETITFAGAKTSGVIINANNSLVNVTVDATMQTTLATGATLDGSIAVTSNTDLESLTLSGANVSVLTVTGNVDLETINGTGLTSIGATAASNNVTITGNKFVASIAQDKTNAAACTSCGNLEANDLGGFTTASGMATMKTYLALVAANTSATASVYWDTVESTTNATGVETVAETTAQGDVTVILALTAEVATAAKGEIAAKRVFLVDVSAAGTIGIGEGSAAGVYGTNLFSNGTLASTAGSLTVVANKELTIANLKNAATVARFAAYDITVDAVRGGRSSQTVELKGYASGGGTGTILGQRYTTGNAANAAVSTTNHGFGVDDTLTLTVGGNSVTVSPGAGGGVTLANLATDVADAWTAKYGVAGTASASGNATVTAAGAILTVAMYDLGPGGYNVDVDFSVAASTGTDSDSTTNAANIDYVIGTTILESDDATVDKDVVLTLLSQGKGTLLDTTDTLSTVTSANQDVTGFGPAIVGARKTLMELTTTKVTNGTDANQNTYVRALMSASPINAEDGTSKVVSTAAQSKTRVHWL